MQLCTFSVNRCHGITATGKSQESTDKISFTQWKTHFLSAACISFCYSFLLFLLVTFFLDVSIWVSGETQLKWIISLHPLKTQIHLREIVGLYRVSKGVLTPQGVRYTCRHTFIHTLMKHTHPHTCIHTHTCRVVKGGGITVTASPPSLATLTVNAMCSAACVCVQHDGVGRRQRGLWRWGGLHQDGPGQQEGAGGPLGLWHTGRIQQLHVQQRGSAQVRLVCLCMRECAGGEGGPE